jgi:dihydrofolate reductase
MSNSFKIKAIVAISKNSVIGKEGDLPWKISEDLKWFKKITLGHTLLMGRKTWESLPGVLPGRENWVLSSNLHPQPGIKVFKTLENALAEPVTGDLFVIGGGVLYQHTLRLCEELYVSEVHRVIKGGDTFFPSFKEDFVIEENLFQNDEFALNRWARKPPKIADQ